MPFTSPGAAFGSGMEDYLMQQQQQQHQLMLDDLAQKREQRLAQAELDAAKERQDTLATKKAKDLSDIHDKKVADYEKRVGQMVPGDRPDPEMVAEGQKLGVFPFRQAAPAMSAPEMQPPAALTESGAGPTAGTTLETAPEAAVTPEGAMTPGPLTYPGSPKQRADADLQKRREAFIAKLPDDMKQEAQLAFEAESLGMKTPAGLLSKTGANAAPKHRVIFDPRAKTYLDAITHKPVTDPAILDNAQIDRSSEPPSDSGSSDRQAARIDRLRENALKEWNGRTQPIEDQITNLNKLSETLSQNTNIADATIAGQIIKTIEGGKNSGVRVTDTAIKQIMQNSRTTPEDLAMMLNRWGLASPEQQKSGVFFDTKQKQAMRELVRAFRKQAYQAHEKAIGWRRKLDDAETDKALTKTRTDAIDDLFTEPVEPDTGITPPTVRGTITVSPSGQFTAPGAR